MTNRWLLEKLKKLSEEELDEKYDHNKCFRDWCCETMTPSKWA